MKNYQILLTAAFCAASLHLLQAQPSPQTLDRIVAVIGEEVILQSDVDNQYHFLRLQGTPDDGSLRCQVLENFIISKLLLDKARQDSLTVDEGQVDSEIDRRVSVILQKIDRSEFERIYGKTLPQFREDIREEIRNELLVDRQRGTLLEKADISPSEVKQFFRNIPEDSLPLFPAEVQLNHIVVVPPVSKESEDRAKQLLGDLRKQVLEQKADFGELASKNTDEPGGRARQGDLGWFGRGDMVPEFEEVVYQMRPGDVSQPFRTEFGYHIVKLIERRGERVHAAHILKRLSASANGDAVAIDSLNKLLKLIAADSLTFEEAAMEYSSDRRTKHCGGCYTDPQTGDLRVPLDNLDADMYFKIEDMKPGQISKPMELLMPDGTRAFHVILLKNRIPPHKPNLKDDYQKIRNAAVEAKQAEIFEKWLRSAKKNIYIDLKPTECYNALQHWIE
ncbi:MAG: peptidylprolyl isomerase [Bacteroidia bacterium]|nr:peptidylprolyl isomerase [Bacteroidia bacterium]